MARWLVVQLDGRERRIPKSVALLAVRRGEAIRPDPTRRVIVELFLRAVPSSLPDRLVRSSLASPIVAVDPLEVLKRAWRASHGLLVNYPIKDQRGKLGKTPKPGAIARAQKNAEVRL